MRLEIKKAKKGFVVDKQIRMSIDKAATLIFTILPSHKKTSYKIRYLFIGFITGFIFAFFLFQYIRYHSAKIEKILIEESLKKRR
jgi:drug/metabolite transporter (DMT)-like permease